MSGNITSPGYPYSYPNNAFCYWELYHDIVAAGDAQWNITIHSFYTQPNRDNVSLIFPTYQMSTK